MAKCLGTTNYTEEEKRIRKQLIDKSVTQSQIARVLNLTRQDVSNVICGICRSPKYVKLVYDYIELDMPKNYGKVKRAPVAEKSSGEKNKEISQTKKESGHPYRMST